MLAVCVAAFTSVCSDMLVSYYPAETFNTPELFHNCPALDGFDVGRLDITTVVPLTVTAPVVVSVVPEKPLSDTTGPEKVVVAILSSPYKVY